MVSFNGKLRDEYLNQNICPWKSIRHPSTLLNAQPGGISSLTWAMTEW